jgi:hypothetical protein
MPVHCSSSSIGFTWTFSDGSEVRDWEEPEVKFGWGTTENDAVEDFNNVKLKAS